MNPIITLITDYGYRDYYIGALKGVILGMAPDVRIIDITHEIQAHQVLPAAFLLRQVWSWYPPGTIHLVIVDPGVGSNRNILLGRYAGRYVVAPDNGLITFVHREMPVEALHRIEERRHAAPEVSATFQGRDIMAPVVAKLALGALPHELGPKTDRLELLSVDHRAKVTEKGLQGSVIYVDHFGTMVTNIHQDQLAELPIQRRACVVHVNDHSIGPIRSTFSDVDRGEPVALVGSCGFVEIAVNQGSAVTIFDPVEQVRVEIRYE